MHVYEFFALAAQAAETIATAAPNTTDPIALGGLLALYGVFIVILAFVGGIIVTE
jgi:hypothetical protein